MTFSWRGVAGEIGGLAELMESRGYQVHRLERANLLRVKSGKNWGRCENQTNVAASAGVPCHTCCACWQWTLNHLGLSTPRRKLYTLSLLFRIEPYSDKVLYFVKYKYFLCTAFVNWIRLMVAWFSEIPSLLIRRRFQRLDSQLLIETGGGLKHKCDIFTIICCLFFRWSQFDRIIGHVSKHKCKSGVV